MICRAATLAVVSLSAAGSSVFALSLSEHSPIARDDLYLQQLPFDAKEQNERTFKPREDLSAWVLEFPIDWAADPFDDRNWQFQLNSWRMTDPLLVEYFRSSDEALLHEALEYVFDWHRFNLTENKQHDYSWYDMAAGIRALRLAFFIDKARRGELALSDNEMNALLELADAHAKRLQIEEEIALNNHGIFQVAGLNLLCLVVEERENCSDGRAFASRWFNKIMTGQFTEEGVHAENSPDYHFFVRNLLHNLSAIQRLDNPVTDLMLKIDNWRPWFVFPTGEIARIGDSGGRSDPLTEDPADPICIEERCFAVADLSESGYAIVRSLPSEEQSSMLFVTGMAHTFTHKHADEMSFELFEFGRFIFVDSGKYGYIRRPMRSYVMGAAAHNTISLDDRRVGPRDIQLSGTLLEPLRHSEAGFEIVGEFERPDMFRQHRSIVYNPGVSLVITDTVGADATRQYVSSLHLAPDLVPQLFAGGFTVKAGGSVVRAELLSEGCQIEVARGQDDPLLGWQSVGYLKMEPTHVVRAVCPGEDRKIIWSVIFD